MIPGFNQNVRLKGRDFHVQTEDSGLPTALVSTHIYVGGTIIASNKTSYAAIAEAEGDNLYEMVKEVMEQQHQLMVRNLLSGVYTEDAGEIRGPSPALVLGDDGDAEGDPVDLDDVMTDFLADVLLPEI